MGSLARGSTSGRSAGGGARVYATANGVPFVDLSFSPPHSGSDGRSVSGAAWSNVARPAGAAASVAAASRGAEAQRGRGGQLFTQPETFWLNGGPVRPGSSRRGGTSNVEIINSDGESDADVEEVNMFIQHVRSIANRAGAAAAGRGYHSPPGQVHHAHMFMGVPGFAYGIAATGPGMMPARSYAVNDNEIDAGATADNALEILDSEDEDEVIEIVMRAQS